MTSQLSSQLQKLQQRTSDDKRLSDSFLFEKSDRRIFSREQIHQMATHGLQLLVTVDNRFHPFIELLFNPQKIRLERKSLLRDEQNEVNNSVEQFLTLLSPHLFRIEAQQVFEYLVRVLEVHIFNVIAVLRCFLPYHDHNLFARALLLLDLRDTGLDFLRVNQERGAPIPRQHLITACIESRKVLRLVCTTASTAARLGVHNGPANALFADVALHLATCKDSEAIWRGLVPYVVEFMSCTRSTLDSAEGDLIETKTPQFEALDFVKGASALREAACTAFLVVSTWCQEVQFSVPMIITLTKPIIDMLQGATNGKESIPSVSDLLSLLDIIFQSHSDVVAHVLFVPLLDNLLSLSWSKWLPWIESVANQASSVGLVAFETLITILARHCLERIRVSYSFASIPKDVLEFLIVATRELPLAHTIVSEILLTLIQSDFTDEKDKVFISTLTESIERRYQNVFDATLASSLNQKSTQEAASKFLSSHLGGARYTRINIPLSGGENLHLPLFACIIHSIPEVRALAVKGLLDMPIKTLLEAKESRDRSKPIESLAKGSVLNLFSHAARRESTLKTAQDFLETGSKLLSRLFGELAEGELPKGSESSRSPSFSKFCLESFTEMLESLTQMSNTHPSIRYGLLKSVLLPLISEKAMATLLSDKNSSDTVSKQLGVGVNGLKAYRVVLFHIFLLYVSVSRAPQDDPFTRDDTENANEINLLRGTIEEILQKAVSTSLPRTGFFFSKNGLSVDEKESSKLPVETIISPSSKEKVGLTSPKKGEATVISIFEAPILLRAVEGVALENLSAALARVKAIVNDPAASLTEIDAASVDSILTIASALFSPTESVKVAQIIKSFLVGAEGDMDGYDTLNGYESQATSPDGIHNSSLIRKSTGYLYLLREVQRTAATKLGESAKASVGRGAKNSFLTSNFLPSNSFTTMLGYALQSVTNVLLKSDISNETILESLFCILGHLGAKFPPLVYRRTSLSRVFFRLISPSSMREASQFLVDWFGLVRSSLFDCFSLVPQPDSSFSLGALALAMFFPFAAPTDLRKRVVEELQSSVLYAASNKVPRTPIEAILMAALREKNISVSITMTTLNSVIESIAREESRFTVSADAAALICFMLSETSPQVSTRSVPALVPVVPYSFSKHVVGHFFPLASAKVPFCAALDLQKLLPMIRSLLQFGSGEVSAHNAKGSPRKGKISCEVGVDAADFLDAVCERYVISGSSKLSAKVSSSELQDPGIELCELLLSKPHIRVINNTVRPVYRHALNMLAVFLQQGLQASDASSIIFSRKKTKPDSTEKEGLELKEAFAISAAQRIAPLLLESAELIGLDVAKFCVQTKAGFHRIFCPLLDGTLKIAVRFETWIDFLEVLAPKAANTQTTSGIDALTSTWEVPSLCTASNFLDFNQAVALLRIVSMYLNSSDPARNSQVECGLESSLEGEGGPPLVCFWKKGKTTYTALRFLTAFLLVFPVIQVKDNEEEEDIDDDAGDNHSKEVGSFFALATLLLQQYPLTALAPVLRQDDLLMDDESFNIVAKSPEVPFNREGLPNRNADLALLFIDRMVRLPLDFSNLLNYKQQRGAFKIRSSILSQGLSLMTSLLLSDDDEENQIPVRSGSHIVRLVTDVLQSVAPLLASDISAKTPSKVSMEDLSEQIGHEEFYLHIPIVALLIRLEDRTFSDSFQYKNVIDLCSNIIISFDIHTQIRCISQLMRLIMDPHSQLGLPKERENGEKISTFPSSSFSPLTGEIREIHHIFRKMVKPNQVNNRQEKILNLITSTLKSDTFLGLFIELQHHNNKFNTTEKVKGMSGRKGGNSAKTKHSSAASGDGEDAESESDGEDDEAADIKASEGTRTNDECMNLLVSALEMFSHYSDLNESTENDALVPEAQENFSQEEGEAPLFGENKSFTMVLELLSGNSLACILAAINEPTFVKCLNRLLKDKRRTLQLKGLEVLLDRLHHSLPTVENILSDEEMDRHRRDILDPKKKLTLMDLVRVKARPLTTKRSFSLFQHLDTLMRDSQQQAEKIINAFIDSREGKAQQIDATKLTESFSIVQLCVANIEELVRIVGSGGSTQAEKALLNVNRAKKITDPILYKHFGNKKKVQEVHDFLSICTESVVLLLGWMRKFLKKSNLASLPKNIQATVEEGILLTTSAFMTALASSTQVMGHSFVAIHCTAILDAIINAMVSEVSEIPSIVSRSEGGSLLRHSTLSALIRTLPSCWHMSQPYLSRIIYGTTHLINIDDSETHYLCVEALTVLESLMDAESFVIACTECLCGIPYRSEVQLSEASHKLSKERTIKIQATSHSFPILYGTVKRRLESLKKDELASIEVLVLGSTIRNNFWLASLHILATSTLLPSSDVIAPVLEAYRTFFLKFKPKHCVRFLRLIAEWAFGGGSEDFIKSLDHRKQYDAQGEDGYQDNESKANAEVSRFTVHRWILFYALFNDLISHLGSIMDFSFPVVVPYIVTTLNSFCAQNANEKGLIPLLALSLEGALESVRHMSNAQTPEPDSDPSVPLEVFFADPEVFNGLMPPLLRQLTNVGYLSDSVHDFAFRAENVVIPSIRAFFSCLSSSSLQTATQAELIRKLRSSNAQVRKITLMCIDGIYEDGGAALASSLMAALLPEVIDLTEDNNRDVAEEARKFCTNLSAMTDQDVLHVLS